MAELRAYALGVAELRGVLGAPPARATQVRVLARAAFAHQAPPRVPDRLGPLYRRVPGSRPLRDDDPTPADLEVLLAAGPVAPARAAATWRLLETVAAGLAWSRVRVADLEPPPGLLRPTGLPVPPAPGLTVGWCPPERAATVPALGAWLGDRHGWAEEAGRAGRPQPDVVVFAAE